MFQSFAKRANGEVVQKETHSAPGKGNPNPPVSAEQALQDQIIASWKEVWEGLYRYGDRTRLLHLDRLKEHYFAAGMSASHFTGSDNTGSSLRRDHTVLGLLGLPLQQQGPRQLQLFNGLSIDSLESVVALLEAYKRQIPAMKEIYAVLRKLEVGFRSPTEADENAVREQFLPLADALAKQLLHLDARLAVLVSSLSDESWEIHGDTNEQYGWFVYDRAYPRQGKSGFSSKISIQ